jgi:hypothetical protein
MARVNPIRILRTAALCLLFLVLALSVTWPMLVDIHRWGVHDWPQFHTYYGVPRRAVVEHGELPGWNPHFYGGTVQWGHPDDPTVSPLFVLILLFGEVAGPKIAIVLALAGGMFSMWLLARHLGCGGPSSLFAAIVWSLNGWHAYHLSVGHCDHITFLFQPLAVYFFLKAIDRPAYRALGGAVVALMYLCGGPYPFVFTSIMIVVFSLFLCGARNSVGPLAAALKTLLFAAGFAMTKLLSTFEFAMLAQSSPTDISGTPLPVVWQAFFDSALGMQEWHAGLRWGAWEYAAFIGFLPAVLFILGAVVTSRRSWPWTACGLVFLITALGSTSPVNFFSLFTAPPGLSGMHVPFRFAVHFILVVAVVGAMGLDLLLRRLSKAGWRVVSIALAGVTLFVAGGNLIWMHYNRPVPLYTLASFLPFKDGGMSPYRPFAMSGRRDRGGRYIPVTYPQTIEVYMAFLEGRRLRWGYDALYPARAARFPGEEDYRGEAFFANADLGNVLSLDSTLSTFRVKYSATDESVLVLNQNFLYGWNVDGARGKTGQIRGLVATEVGPGEGEVVFRYSPAGRFWGSLVTLATIALSLFLRLGRGRRREARQETST